MICTKLRVKVQLAIAVISTTNYFSVLKKTLRNRWIEPMEFLKGIQGLRELASITPLIDKFLEEHRNERS